MKCTDVYRRALQGVSVKAPIPFDFLLKGIGSHVCRGMTQITGLQQNKAGGNVEQLLNTK